MVGVTTVDQKRKPTMVGVTTVDQKSKKLPVNTPNSDIFGPTTFPVRYDAW